MRRLRILAGAAIAAAAATVTLATSYSPAFGSTRALSAVSGVIAPKTADKSPEVRVNQVGYPTGAPKVAFAMLPTKVASVRFEVITPDGTAYRGVSTDDIGAWNASYQGVTRC